MSESIYKIRAAEGYELVQPVDVEYEDLYQTLNGVSRAAVWTPVEVRLVTQDLGNRLLRSDAPYLSSGALVLRTSAANVVSGTIAGFAEILPLQCAQAELVLLNVTNVVDALDGTSNIARFPDGRILRIQRHEFRPDVVAGQRMFKLARMRVSPVYVDEVFMTVWSGAELTGLDFEPVWRRRN